MIKLTIDGKEIEVEEGTNVLNACEKAGIEIPRFCYHEKLSIAGSCRMCLVQIENMRGLSPSCVIPCSDGMVVHTNTDEIKTARQNVMEMLLINHPLDCPVCDQGGECDLQDEAFAYGGDRCKTKEDRRIVKDKELGPLIKTVMNRCIHCTRCIRFMDEIAGSPELASINRGEKMEITNINDTPLISELSGNLVDVCPVGALTSKPSAFRFRPWELSSTNSIDVMDAVGSNIRIDSRDQEVMRILPRKHDEINEMWISDKARYSCDGLKMQRLDTPYLRGNDNHLHACSWDKALTAISKKIKNTLPDKTAALVGDHVDCESIFTFKEFLDDLDVQNIDCRTDGGVYDVSSRCYYIMNSTIVGIEKADVILLIGTNPRHEATMINARIFKRYKTGKLKVGLIGCKEDLTYPYEHIGHSSVSLRDLLEEKHDFVKILKNAKYPMLILGSGVLTRKDGSAIHSATRAIAEKYNIVRGDWNGFNVLQSVASRVGGLDLGFVPKTNNSLTARAILPTAMGDRLDVLYLMGEDNLDPKRLGKNTFVIYQGSHGDRSAQRADVILPSLAYTEKQGTYVNTEGRVQQTNQAVNPIGKAMADWDIISRLSQIMGNRRLYRSFDDVNKAMVSSYPHLGKLDEIFKSEWKSFGKMETLSLHPFSPSIKNYYMTDPISRASETMANCSREILPLIKEKGGS